MVSGIPNGGVHQWSSVCDVNSMKIKINRHALYVDRSKRFWLVLKILKMIKFAIYETLSLLPMKEKKYIKNGNLICKIERLCYIFPY